MRHASAIVLTVLIFVTGCAHKVAGPAATAVKVRSSYAEKIKGDWAIVIDEGSTIFSRDIEVSSFECSAHSVAFDSGDSIQVSLTNATKNIFEEVMIRKTNPTIDDMKRENISGYVLISLDHFLPLVECRSGFWSDKCRGEAEIVFGIDARGQTGEKLLGTTAGGRGHSEGGSGAFCGNIGKIFGKAYQKALSRSLEELVEKVSNSKRIRKEKE